MMTLLDLLTIAGTGLMVGNEIAIAAFVHPAISKLKAQSHLSAAKSIAAPLGRVMPLWYGLGLLMLSAEAWGHRSHAEPFHLLAVAAVLWAATIIFTIVALVPRNNRIAASDPLQPYVGWQRDRRTWDALHRVRVAVLTLAFLLLLIAILR